MFARFVVICDGSIAVRLQFVTIMIMDLFRVLVVLCYVGSNIVYARFCCCRFLSCLCKSWLL